MKIFCLFAILLSVGMLGMGVSSVTQANDPFLSAVAWHPNGEILAVGYSDGEVRLLDTDQTMIQRVDLLDGIVSDLVWSPDGIKLGGAAGTNFIYIYETDAIGNLNQVAMFDTPAIVTGMDWNATGTQLVSVHKEGSISIALWDTVTYAPQPVSSIYACAPAADVSWHHPSNRVVIGCTAGLLLLTDQELTNLTGVLVDSVSVDSRLYGPITYQDAIDWSENGDLVAVGEDLGVLRIIDVSINEPVLEVQLTAGIRRIVWDWRTDLLAVATFDGKITVFDAQSGDVRQIIELPTIRLPIAMDWNPSTGQLAYGDGSSQVAFVDILPFDAPTNLAVTSSSPVGLSWQDNSADEDGFIVSRQVDGGDWQDIATLPADTTTYWAAACGVANFRVRAVRESPLPLESLPSNQVTITRPACVPAGVWPASGPIRAYGTCTAPRASVRLDTTIGGQYGLTLAIEDASGQLSYVEQVASGFLGFDNQWELWADLSPTAISFRMIPISTGDLPPLPDNSASLVGDRYLGIRQQTTWPEQMTWHFQIQNRYTSACRTVTIDYQCSTNTAMIVNNTTTCMFP